MPNYSFCDKSNIIGKYGVLTYDGNKSKLCIIWNNYIHNTNAHVKDVINIISVMDYFKVDIIVVSGPYIGYHKNVDKGELYNILSTKVSQYKNATEELQSIKLLLENFTGTNVIYIESMYAYFDHLMDLLDQVKSKYKFDIVLPYSITEQQLNNLANVHITNIHQNHKNTENFAGDIVVKLCTQYLPSNTHLLTNIIMDHDYNLVCTGKEILQKFYTTYEPEQNKTDEIIIDCKNKKILTVNNHSDNTINFISLSHTNDIQCCICIIDHILKNKYSCEYIIDIYTKIKAYLTNKFNDKNNQYSEYDKNHFVFKLKQLAQDIFTNSSINTNDDKMKDISQMILSYAKNADSDMKQKRHENVLISRYITNSKLVQNLSSVNDEIDEYIDEVDEDNEVFEKSTDFYNSFLSLTDWFDEIQSGGSIGLLTNISTTPLGKLGINCGIKYNDISTSFIPIEDYLFSALKYFNDNPGDAYGNLNDKNIIKNDNNSYNSVIPLYINKFHWICTKKFIPFVLGISLSHNPLGFTEKHHLFFFSLLSQFTARLVCNNDYNNDTRITTYISYLRTCMQVSIDNGYSRGIYKLIDHYLNDNKKHVLPSIDAYQTILGQLLCVRLNKNQISKVDMITEYILEDVFRISLKKYSVQFLFDIFSHNALTRKEFVFSELDKVMDSISEIIYAHIDVLMSFYTIVNIMESIYTDIGSYNKFLQLMEENYSIISSEYLQMIKNSLNKNNRTLEEFYKIRNVKHTTIDNYNCRKYLYILQGIEHCNNKDRYTAIENGKYIDCNNSLMTIDELYNHYNNIYKNQEEMEIIIE